MAEAVANFDIVTIADYCVGFSGELISSQSARQAEFTQFDRDRAKSYLERIKAFVALVGEKKLDLPKSHPGAYPVAAFPEDEKIDALENQVVKGVLRRFKAAYTEVVGSQSKDMASGMHAADITRVNALIDATLELVDFGADTLDLPEDTGPNVATA